MRQFLSRILSPRTTPKRPARPKKTSLHVETLEKRDLMAVAVPTLTGGVLRINGDGANDNVEIRETSSGPIILFNPGVTSTGAITVKDLTTNNSWSFERSQVQRIDVDLGAGHDRLDSDSFMPTSVLAGEGNDFIITGSGNDTIVAGAGNDTVVAGAGDDIVHGEDGDDVVQGGFGNDALFGYAGADVLAGEGDNDVISGGDSDSGNQLLGADGDDTLFSSSRDDLVAGGLGYDTLTVLAGTRAVQDGENVTISTDTTQPQTDGFSCGPNSGSRMLRAYGVNVSYDEMRRKVKAESILFKFKLGTRPSVLRKVLAKYKGDLGLTTKASMEDVLNHLRAGKPVIALIASKTKSLSIGGKYGILHYVVINGFDEASQTVRYVDTNGATGSWTLKEFDHKWKWFDHFTGVLGEGAQKVVEGLGLRKRTFIA